jgi:uncharacterized membrane protein YhaH (DUF805 family)
MLHFLFGFSGRINRAKMWLFFLLYFVFACAGVFAVLSAIGLNHLAAIGQHKEDAAMVFANPALKPTFGVLGLIYMLFIWMDLAVKTKRLHDRDKSAWWLLVFVALPLALGVARLVTMFGAMHAHGAPGMDPIGTLLGGASFLIQIWAFVELYCLRGTVGENRFGPDPLAGG